jgi:hypothetical protein
MRCTDGRLQEGVLQPRRALSVPLYPARRVLVERHVRRRDKLVHTHGVAVLRSHKKSMDTRQAVG